MTTKLGPPVVVVSGGLGRTIYIVGCLLLGVVVWRRPQPPVRLLWLGAVVLAARCGFEAVMCPYYLAPPLILGLMMVARLSRRRLVVATVVAFAISIYAYIHLSPWVWWPPILAGLIVVMGLAYPSDLVGPDRVTEYAMPADRSAGTSSAAEQVGVRELALSD